MFQKFNELNKAKKLQEAFSSEKVKLEREGIEVTVSGQMKIEEIRLNSQLTAEEQGKALVGLLNEAFSILQKKVAAKILKEKLF